MFYATSSCSQRLFLLSFDKKERPHSSTLFTISLHNFFLEDRQLYTTLVIHLYRDPCQSMVLLSLWHWLQRVGFRNMQRVGFRNLSLLQSLIVGNDISLTFFLENRVEAICGMEKTRQEGRG